VTPEEEARAQVQRYLKARRVQAAELARLRAKRARGGTKHPAGATKQTPKARAAKARKKAKSNT